MIDRWVRINVRVSPSKGVDDFISQVLGEFDTCGASQTSDDGAMAEWAIYFEPDKVPGNFVAKVQVISREFGIKADVEPPCEQLRENWHKGWREYFKPVQVTPRFRILPAWEKPEAG